MLLTLTQDWLNCSAIIDIGLREEARDKCIDKLSQYVEVGVCSTTDSGIPLIEIV